MGTRADFKGSRFEDFLSKGLKTYGYKVVAIAVAGLCSSKSWQNTSMTWDEFCEKLKNPFRDNVNMPAYMRMSKVEQDKREDGWESGGSLSGVQKT